MRFAIMLPVNVKYLGYDKPWGPCPDLAQLTRLTQLKALHLQNWNPLTQPLPHLPSLLSLQGRTEDLQPLSPVALTLQELRVEAPHFDFRPPNTLAHFTRLHTLSVTADTIRNFNPKVLPLSVGSITVTCCVPGHSDDADQLAFPAGGHTVTEELEDIGEFVISWTRHSPDA